MVLVTTQPVYRLAIDEPARSRHLSPQTPPIRGPPKQRNGSFRLVTLPTANKRRAQKCPNRPQNCLPRSK